MHRDYDKFLIERKFLLSWYASIEELLTKKELPMATKIMKNKINLKGKTVSICKLA